MYMKNGSTIFLRCVLCVLATVVAGLAIFWLPRVVADGIRSEPELSSLKWPFMFYIYTGTVPFFYALYQADTLLRYIGTTQVFSELSVRAVRNIKYAAIMIVGLLAAGMVYAAAWVDGDRSPLIALGMCTAFAACVVATFAAVLQKLLQSAIEIKTENELTV